MKRVTFLLVVAAICFGAREAWATNVQLYLTTSDPNQLSGTWTVTAELSDSQSLGIAAFSIDVHGIPDGPIGGITVLKAATVSQTLQVSNPPYTLFRSTGTLSAPNLTGIGAA